jgi:hypothetical protein
MRMPALALPSGLCFRYPDRWVLPLAVLVACHVAAVCLFARAMGAARCYFNSASCLNLTPDRWRTVICDTAYSQAFGLSLSGEGACHGGSLTSAT